MVSHLGLHGRTVMSGCRRSMHIGRARGVPHNARPTDAAELPSNAGSLARAMSGPLVRGLSDLFVSTPDALAVVTELVGASRRKHRDGQVA